jgi:preprotein translocase SecE subunit
MKWFSIKGIQKEMGRIRWASGKNLQTNSSEVIVFTLFFVAFFVLVQFLLTMLLRVTGVVV